MKDILCKQLIRGTIRVQNMSFTEMARHLFTYHKHHFPMCTKSHLHTFEKAFAKIILTTFKDLSTQENTHKMEILCPNILGFFCDTKMFAVHK